MMFPSAIALLHGHGSMNCNHNMKKPLYAPIQLTLKPEEILELPALGAYNDDASPIVPRHGPIQTCMDLPRSLPTLPALTEELRGKYVRYGPTEEFEIPDEEEPEPDYEVLTYLNFMTLIEMQNEEATIAAAAGFSKFEIHPAQEIVLEPKLSYAYKLPPISWTQPGKAKEFPNEKDFLWILPKDFLLESTRFEGLLEQIHSIRNDGGLPDTIALTFNNGKRTIRSPNFGRSTKHTDTVAVTPTLKEITCHGEDGIEIVTLHHQPKHCQSTDVVFQIKSTRSEDYQLKRILFDCGQSIVGIYGKMTPRGEIIWFNFLVNHPWVWGQY